MHTYEHDEGKHINGANFGIILVKIVSPFFQVHFCKSIIHFGRLSLLQNDLYIIGIRLMYHTLMKKYVMKAMYPVNYIVDFLLSVIREAQESRPRVVLKKL